jgi:hypothetical protein
LGGIERGIGKAGGHAKLLRQRGHHDATLNPLVKPLSNMESLL